VTHTRATTVVLLIIIGGVIGAFIETALAAAGRPIIIPPLTLPVALVAIGIIILLLALPIRRMVKGKHKVPVDPFYATRVVMLAKASAISGALLFGAGGGVIVYLVTRSAAPTGASLTMSIGTTVGAGILLAAGLIAERMCTIPPTAGGDEDKPGKEPAPAQP
jgi:hypothetical protein